MKTNYGIFINPEYVTDPPQIAEMIAKPELISLRITRLKSWAVQMKSQIELIEKEIEVLEMTRKQIG